MTARSRLPTKQPSTAAQRPTEGTEGTEAASRGSWPTDGRTRGIARLLVSQVRYQVLLLLRSPSGPFFTFLIPLMLLITLNLVYGDRVIPTRGGISFPQFYTPAMVAFAVVNACYVNVINGTTIAREAGVLKRIRGTPLPGWAYLCGRIGAAAALAAASVVGVLFVGTTFFPADMVWGTLPGTVVTVALGIACASTLGLAVTRAVATTDAALPMAYGTFLPVAFISDVFFPSDTSPAWLRALASVLPLRPLARSLEANMLPGASGLGFHWPELAVLAAWTVAASVIAATTFRWERGRARRPGRRATRASTGPHRNVRT